MKNKIKELLKIENKWYHKIPFVGKSIFKKQRLRKYQRNKFIIFEFIESEVDRNLQKKLKTMTTNDAQEFKITYEYNYTRPNWSEIIDRNKIQ